MLNFKEVYYILANKLQCSSLTIVSARCIIRKFYRPDLTATYMLLQFVL